MRPRTSTPRRRASRARPPLSSALCLYIQDKLVNDESALLDSAVMGPDDGTVLPQAAGLFVPTAELEAVRDTIRRTTVFGRR